MSTPDRTAARDALRDLAALERACDRHQIIELDGWAPLPSVADLAARIENEDAPAGEPESVRVGADDLRVLLDAAEGAAGRSPQTDADRAWIAAITDVVDRIGTLAAHTRTDTGQ